MKRTMRLPTVPYTIVDAINRHAAATGSPRYAMAAASADYNGHPVDVAFNSYRGYWVADYTWAGRVVVGRGNFRETVAAAMRYYGPKGSSVTVYGVPSDDDAAWLATKGFVDGAEPAWAPDDLRVKVSDAFWTEKHLGIPAISFLARSKTVEEYEAAVEAYRAEKQEGK
jgi:hypothetical protein